MICKYKKLFRALQSLSDNDLSFIGFTTDLGLLFSQSHLEFALLPKLDSIALKSTYTLLHNDFVTGIFVKWSFAIKWRKNRKAPLHKNVLLTNLLCAFPASLLAWPISILDKLMLCCTWYNFSISDIILQARFATDAFDQIQANPHTF